MLYDYPYCPKCGGLMMLETCVYCKFTWPIANLEEIRKIFTGLTILDEDIQDIKLYSYVKDDKIHLTTIKPNH